MTSPLAQLEAAISESFQMLMHPPKGLCQTVRALMAKRFVMC